MKDLRAATRGLAFSMLALLGSGGCDSRALQQPGQPVDSGQPVTLQLVVSDVPLELVAPTSLVVQLLVIGAGGNSVTITTPGAPAFASLSGTLLTLAPTREDVGRHDIPLVATTATQQANASLHVIVTRANTGPMWLPPPGIGETMTDASERPVIPRATMEAMVCDKEGDNITFQVEVIPAGTAFAGVATHSQSVDFAVTPPVSHYQDMACHHFLVPLNRLEPGDYDLRILAVDALGQTDPYGWVEIRGFTLAP
jgi:hypothetical protein